MKLAAYLSEAEIRDSDFADRIGVTRQTLWRYKAGERRPEWDILERIKRESGGQVTPNDFLDDQASDAAAADLGAAANRFAPANGDTPPEPRVA